MAPIKENRNRRKLRPINALSINREWDKEHCFFLSELKPGDRFRRVGGTYIYTVTGYTVTGYTVMRNDCPNIETRSYGIWCINECGNSDYFHSSDDMVVRLYDVERYAGYSDDCGDNYCMYNIVGYSDLVKGDYFTAVNGFSDEVMYVRNVSDASIEVTSLLLGDRTVLSKGDKSKRWRVKRMLYPPMASGHSSVSAPHFPSVSSICRIDMGRDYARVSYADGTVANVSGTVQSSDNCTTTLVATIDITDEVEPVFEKSKRSNGRYMALSYNGAIIARFKLNGKMHVIGGYRVVDVGTCSFRVYKYPVSNTSGK